LRKNQLIGITALAGLLFSVACSEKPKGPDKFNPNAPVAVDITITQNQQVEKGVEVNGSILANDYVELRPETNGRITFLQVPEGKVVKAGTVIAKLNDADLQAQLAKAKVNLDLAVINEQRNKQLLAVKGMNQSDYDVSLQQVKSIQADIAYTQSLIDKTIVKAPFTGQIGLRQVSVGAFVSTTTTIATLQSTDHLKMDFTIPEMYASYVAVGKKVNIATGGNTANKVTATITAIEPQISTASRNLKIRTSFQGKVLPGAFAKVYLLESNPKPSIMVPSNVIIPDSKTKQIVIVKNGVAKFVPVETGYRTQTAVEITKGLQVGDSVIVAGMLFVKDGSKLKIGKTLANTDITK
jgi:membrane fusion protein (multidrug efflux system)